MAKSERKRQVTATATPKGEVMKLRWFKMCNKDGVWTKPILQFWNEEGHCWEDVPFVDCKTWEEEKYLQDEFAV